MEEPSSDNSLALKETESNSILTSSFESESPVSQNLKNHIVNAIVSNLNEIIEDNNRDNNKYIRKDNVFYLDQLPSISLKNYIWHLVTYTEMDFSTLIISIIYIDKFCEKNNYFLSLNNVYRLLLISIFISLKYNEDKKVNLGTYAYIAGVSVEDLKMLEHQMCNALHFEFFVQSDYYQEYFSYFCKYSS